MKLEDCVLIDNNNTLIHSESSRLILCSTFDYRFYQDPLRYLPLSEVEKNLPQIIKSLHSIDVFSSIKPNVSFNKFYVQYYKKTISNLMIINCDRNSNMWYVVHAAFKTYMSKNKKGIKDSFVLKVNEQLKHYENR